ncbi:putative 2-aminoethylphosphonate ABC transporter ATP-binding protein [Rubrimonas cliftonensis]|uniref:Iron(III) transport system ATP-binding protein n=1 Tax=Rubrimonas cliftonensis TaxID=89524 RepID=A0A1H4FKW8_9RHOB|nr:putative 2-aminoethylphosphonate ABC transporter ATP-binding protein [Rubrimonas cliftonensis]SEA97801.1 iron(III) transport system ATP-binding protein [Rubrimonas cliftonensis]
MPEPYLRIRNVSKRFGDFTALRDVNLDIGKGEFVCFLGPSGCGKTTLLRAIAGLDIQSEGMIEQAGRDISALPPSERDFGIVFQSYALFPNLTVADNVGYGLVGKGMPRADIRKKVAGLLAQVNLPDQGAKYPAKLSGGQQQRVALARALATEPGLLLLDEPLSALDAKVRIQLRGQLKDLQRDLGITTIMVTHDQEEALGLADRIVVMSQGRVEQVGSPVEIYTSPASVFVADFIGAMNFVPARVAGPGMIEIGSARFAAETAHINGDGRALAAIRPEDIKVQGVAPGDANALEVTIDAEEFCGSYMRATVIDAALGEARLKADLSMNLVRGMALTKGSRLPVALPPERLRVYPPLS